MSTFLLYPALAVVIPLLSGAGSAQIPMSNSAPAALVAPIAANTDFTRVIYPNQTPLQTHLQSFSTSCSQSSPSMSRPWFPVAIGMSVTIFHAQYFPSPDGIGSTDMTTDNAEVIGISAVPGAAPPVLHHESTETTQGQPKDDTVWITPKGVSGDVVGVVGQLLQNSIGMK